MSKKTLATARFVVFGLGIVAAVLLLFKAFKTGDGDLLEGTRVIFGGVREDNFANFDYKMNVFLLVALIAPVAGGVLALVKQDKLGAGLSILLFVIGIVLLVVTKDTNYLAAIGGVEQTISVDIELATLGWVSLVLSGIAALVSVGLVLED